MTTLPHDVARCAGLSHGTAKELAGCTTCRRRQAFLDADPGQMLLMMQPPLFLRECPYRIEP